jgi:uncharacterized DUF497 family protein
MKITFDPKKRAETLRTRGLDFADAKAVFDGPTFTVADQRFEYPEDRYITVGLLSGRMVIVVWTPDEEVPNEDGRRIISMRKANDREKRRFGQRLG